MSDNSAESNELQYLLELLINSTNKSDKRRHLRKVLNIYSDTISKLNNENKNLKDALVFSSNCNLTKDGRLLKMCEVCCRDKPLYVSLYVASHYVQPVVEVSVIVPEWKGVYKFKLLSHAASVDMQVVAGVVNRLPSWVSIRELHIASESVYRMYNYPYLHQIVGDDKQMDVEFVQMRETVGDRLSNVPIFMLTSDDMGNRATKYLSRGTLDQVDESVGWFVQIME